MIPAAGGGEDHLIEDPQVPNEPLLPKGPPVDRVEFLHSGSLLLIEDEGKCAELVRKIKGEPLEFPAVGGFTFGGLYEKATQDQLQISRITKHPYFISFPYVAFLTIFFDAYSQCIGSSNLLIARYEKELKSTLIQLEQAHEVAQEKDRSLVCKEEELKVAKKAEKRAESRASKRKKKMKAKVLTLRLELEVARSSIEELKEKNV